MDSFTEKQARKIFGTLDQNHGLILLEICKFFNQSNMIFLSSKKPLFVKTTSSQDKLNVSFGEKQGRKVFETFDQNHELTPSEICKFFNFSKMSFYRLNSLLLRKEHHQTTKPRSLLQKSRLERYLEFLTRITSQQVWKLRRMNLAYTFSSMHGKCQL